MTYYVGLSSGT